MKRLYFEQTKQPRKQQIKYSYLKRKLENKYI